MPSQKNDDSDRSKSGDVQPEFELHVALIIACGWWCAKKRLVGYNNGMIICILGRQPRIGLAELEAVFGASTIQPLGNEAALLDIETQAITHPLLGSTIKVGKILTVLNAT